MMATFEQARRLEGTGVAVTWCTPAWWRRGSAGSAGRSGWPGRCSAASMLTSEQGADTPLHLALSPLVAGQTGLYWKKRQPARPNRQALDQALVRRLWQATEQLVG